MSEESSEGVLYAVLVEDVAALEQTPLIVNVVATALGVPIADVSQRVRYGGGFVVRGVDLETATAVSTCLEEEGLGSFLLSEEECAISPRPVKVTSCEISKSELQVTIGHQTPKQIAWPKIRALHAYAIARDPEEDQPRRQAMPVVVAGEKLDDKAREELRNKTYSVQAQKIIEDLALWASKHRGREVQFFIDLLCFDPPALYRIKRHEFHYGGLGDKLRQHSLDNYLVLLEELVRHAGEAVVDQRTLRFLGKADFQALLLGKQEELVNYTSWVLQLLLHRPEAAKRSAVVVPMAPDMTHFEDSAVWRADDLVRGVTELETGKDVEERLKTTPEMAHFEEPSGMIDPADLDKGLAELNAEPRERLESGAHGNAIPPGRAGPVNLVVTPSGLEVEVESAHGGVDLLRPLLAVDQLFRESIVTDIADMLKGRKRVVLDCDRIELLSGDGIDALVTAGRRAREDGGEIVLCRVAAAVDLEIRAKGADEQLRCFESPGAALAALSG